MAGCYRKLNVHEFEQTLGDNEGQEELACWRPWDREQLDTTERLNNNTTKVNITHLLLNL